MMYFICVKKNELHFIHFIFFKSLTLYNATTRTVEDGVQSDLFSSTKWQPFPDGFYRISFGLSDATDENIFNLTVYQQQHFGQFFEF